MGLPNGVILLVVALAFGSSLAKTNNSDVCEELFYPVYAEDYQYDISDSRPQLNIELGFYFPFYGFRYNNTRISMNGYLEFPRPLERYAYPLKFPRNYPSENEPAFIGPFYSKTRIGARPEGSCVELDDGVYFRVESDLQNRTDEVAMETRQRVQDDIRGGNLVAVGATEFDPKHVFITTWLGVSFAGGIENSTNITNSFQAVVATDEVATYVIFNYDDINWTTHTEAGGDSATGLGGTPALVGFYDGNTAFEYHPYSQSPAIQIINETGCANGFDSRHIFRVDRNIIPGACSMDTNSFQAVVATDEVATYVIFNYDDINWTTHTEAGGDSATGLGGTPALVGFYDGNTAFEYHPYSQSPAIQIINETGCANGFDSRHIFRVDRNIIPGACSMDIDFVCRNYLQMPPAPYRD